MEATCRADPYRASGENALVLFLHVVAQNHEGTWIGACLVELAEELGEIKGTWVTVSRTTAF